MEDEIREFLNREDYVPESTIVEHFEESYGSEVSVRSILRDMRTPKLISEPGLHWEFQGDETHYIVHYTSELYKIESAIIPTREVWKDLKEIFDGERTSFTTEEVKDVLESEKPKYRQAEPQKTTGDLRKDLRRINRDSSHTVKSGSTTWNEFGIEGRNRWYVIL